MGKLGIHSLVFTDDWNEASAHKACSTAVEAGFELMEVLIFDPDKLDVKMTRHVIAEHGLEVRLGMALGPDTDISSGDAQISKAGEDTVEKCLQIASDLGAPAVSGITYAAFNNYTKPATEAQRQSVVAALSRLDGRAGELGIKLGLEAVNRYESYLVNTLDQAGGLIREINAKNMFVHMDTFHMNIEESDIVAAIVRNADLLGYVHFAESNRGVLGSGNFPADDFFRALAQVGYQGDVTVESFSPQFLSEDLVGGVKLWRSPWDNTEKFAKDAYNYVQTRLSAAKYSQTVW